MLTELEVMKLEDQRCNSMLSGDLVAMEELFSEQMLWIHGSGIVDTKRSLIERFEQGTTRCYRLDRAEVIIRIFGNAAVVTGVVDMDAEFAGKRGAVLSRFTGVWSAEDGTPKLVTWQSARLISVNPPQ